jgi:transcriptional regulator with XRE-family HTH domain
LDINARIARRIFALREDLGLSIEHLADRSGVSRAMISKIERGESSPTATVLNKLAVGLDVLLPSLFSPASFREPRLNLRDPVSSRAGQAEWKDPATGYKRRTLTPTTARQPLQLSEIHFPAGARVTFDDAFTGAAPQQQQIWMLEGQLALRVGTDVYDLGAGDCIAMTLDRPTSFHNPGRTTARYLVAAVSNQSPYKPKRL